MFMLDVKNIVKGIVNQKLDKTNNNIFERNITFEKRSSEIVRAGICSICEFIDTTIIFKKVKEDKYPKIQGKKCSICKCILSYKIRSESKCPLNKWR